MDELIFSFGLIGDTQYVDAEDGTNFEGSIVRRYRQSLETLLLANAHFNSLNKTQKLLTSVLLGDLIDIKTIKLNTVDAALDAVLAATSNTDIFDAADAAADAAAGAAEASPRTREGGGRHCWKYVLGNHDLTALTRAEAYARLIPADVAASTQQCSPDKLYYHCSPCLGHRFVFLDSFDISLLNASSPSKKLEAEQILKDNNPNYENFDKPSCNWFHNLLYEDHRYVPFNGGLSSDQLCWLDAVLQEARASNELVYIFCHCPCHPQSCQSSGLMWNSETLLELLHTYTPNVVAVFAGHDHVGGYVIDEFGIHHLVAPAPLECGKDEPAFGDVSVYADRMVLNWVGKQPPSPHMAWPTEMIFRR